ncbi:MAG: hypothetical protein ABSA59_14145 [Terriglobia bacterium]|jgi:hypothetical protein
MKKLLKTLPLLALILLFTASVGHAQSATGTTSVTVNVAAEAALTVASPTALTAIGSVFNNYTGSTLVTYFIRTKQSTGSGTISLQVTTDFSPAGGPSVGTPPTAGDALKYTCSGAAPATPCTGSQPASTGSSSPVASFGADAHTTTTAGSTVTTSWTLTNDPVYKTGAYSATVTFTISAS